MDAIIGCRVLRDGFLVLDGDDGTIDFVAQFRCLHLHLRVLVVIGIPVIADAAPFATTD